MFFTTSLIRIFVFAVSTAAVPVVPRALSAYAPVIGACPGTALVRPASGLSSSEQAFVSQRKPLADAALKTWLSSVSSEFDTDEDLPIIGLTTSGGGYRSLLVGAGVIQGFDSRDSNVSTSGLFQALTYQAGLSGGAWLLSSFAGNNYPTITSLKENLWESAFQDSLLDPDFLLAGVAYAEITADVVAKDAAGFPPTLTDPWGRLLSWQLLNGNDGGVSTTLSSIATLSNFTSHAVPFPIITSLGVKTWDGECTPGPNATTYEFNPFEFGSWDEDLSAFAQTAYLGSSLSNGQPTAGTCITNYDNLGYVLGTSSNLFNEVCAPLTNPVNSSTNLTEDLETLISTIHELTTRDEYAVYPNPFANYTSSSSTPNPANPISAQPELHLVDGGEALQNNPLFPLLHPARNISVILVNDNSADTSNNFPNGSEILTTYVQSLSHPAISGRMPVIPSVETFISEGLNERATVFGCNSTSAVTIVWIPNVAYSYASGTSTAKVQYSKEETEGMVANGVEVASQNGDEGWGFCLGCVVLKKQDGMTLPGGCEACFAKYCYN